MKIVRLSLAALLVANWSGVAVGRGSAVSSHDLIPIPTGAPSWFTDALAKRLLKDGYAPLPTDDPTRIIGASAPGIHSSQWLQTITAGAGGIQSETCTGGFIFRKRASFGLGAAGHCAPRGAAVSAYVRPPVDSGRPPGLYVIGKVVLSSGEGAPAGSDFALARIEKRFRSWVDPRMPFWDGPTGVYRAKLPTPVAYVGHGLATGAGGVPRVGYADHFDQKLYGFVGPAGPGDSGGAVLTTGGLAAGNQTHTYLPESASSPRIVFGTRVVEMLRQARGWELATAR